MISKWCSKCRRQVPEPPTDPTSVYAKFWRDSLCYVCNSPLGPVTPLTPSNEIQLAVPSPVFAEVPPPPPRQPDPAAITIGDPAGFTKHEDTPITTSVPTPSASLSKPDSASATDDPQRVIPTRLRPSVVLLVLVHVGLSILAIATAGLFGNSLTADHVPVIHSANWFFRFLMKALTAPDTLVDWLFGWMPKTVIPLVLSVSLAAELAIIRFSPLVDYELPMPAAERAQLSASSNPRAQAARWRQKVRRRLILRLVALSVHVFTLGVSAGAVAWGMALLIDDNAGGVLQTAALALGVLVLMVLSGMLGETVPEMIEDSEPG